MLDRNSASFRTGGSPLLPPLSFDHGIQRSEVHRLMSEKMKPEPRRDLSLAYSGYTLTGTPTAGSTLLVYSFGPTLALARGR